MKLTSRNFWFWRTQLLPFLRGQDLIGYVDGTTPCPPAFLSASGSGELGSGATTAPSTPNPAHKAWVLQDQSILSLLISSMSDEVLHLAVGRDIAAAVWRSICTALGSNTQARCLSLLGQFQALRQGASTPGDYLGKAELLVEALAQAGQPISMAEQNLYVIRGLRPEYRAYAASLTAHAPVSLPHLADHLQAADFILADDFADGAGSSSHSAFYAGRGSGSGGRNSGGHGSAEGGRQNNWRGGRGGRNQRGGGRNQRGGGPRCQICRAQGHTAIYCYKRYTTQPPAQAHVAVSGETPVTTVPSSEAWYPDTGVTAHATPEAGMLTSSEEYIGPDTLRVGNGTGLKISRRILIVSIGLSLPKFKGLTTTMTATSDK